MIKATELRIGNLVLDSTGNVHKIERLDEKWDFSDIKPIQLNEEWLVSGGFNKKSEKWYFFKTKNHVGECGIFYIHIITSGVDLYIKRNGEMSGVVGSIVSVHQLQNLYFCLTGEELVFSSTEP